MIEWINATLIANGVNMNINDCGLLTGILRTLGKSGQAVPIQDYVDAMEDGQVNADKIGAHF